MGHETELNRQRRQAKIARLEIVADLYKKGYSIRKIVDEIKKRLQLEVLSPTTVASDIKTLLAEWRKSRIDDMDLALQLELERIDDTVRELWLQWEKSKQDYTKTANRRKGAPQRAHAAPGQQQPTEETIRTILTEENRTQVIRLGDVSYIAEIRAQLAERRKLLGIYAPDKKQLTGKDGDALIPPTTQLNIDDFTPEELALIVKIARQNEQKT